VAGGVGRRDVADGLGLRGVADGRVGARPHLCKDGHDGDALAQAAEEGDVDTLAAVRCEDVQHDVDADALLVMAATHL
jgi:hypothetical protein